MAGGGVKINNISVRGGANGKTPTFALGESISQTSGHLYNSYDNGVNWHDLGQVKGADGIDGENGINGINGVDGATPLFKIQNGYLYNSYDGGETWESLGYVRGNDGADGAGTNPNLLINSNFAINQRGQSSYTGANKYAIDRWLITTSTSTITVNTNGITLSASSDNAYCQQRIENGFNLLKGKEVTLSVSIGGTIYTTSGTVPSSIPSTSLWSLTPISATNTVATSLYLLNTSGLLFVQLGATAGHSVAFDWAKLEIGDTATGYTPPLIAEELPKCQRYYTKIDTSVSANKYQIYRFARSNYALYDAQVFFPVRMRTRPTIALFSTNTDTEGYLYNLTQTADQQFSTGYITTDGFQFGNTNGNMSANNMITGYYAADAEIY